MDYMDESFCDPEGNTCFVGSKAVSLMRRSSIAVGLPRFALKDE